MKYETGLSIVIMVLIGIGVPSHNVTFSIDSIPLALKSPLVAENQNNVTLLVDGVHVFFIGDDVWAKTDEYFPGLTDNDTVLTLMHKYNNELLFITRTPRSEYVTIVAMNESIYVEFIIQCTFEHNVITKVQKIEELTSSTYNDSLKDALSTIMIENATRNLNVTSWEQYTSTINQPVKAYLWSYAYTGNSLYFEDNPSYSLYSSPNADALLDQLHWEIITIGNITQRIPTGPPDVNMWEYDEIEVLLVFSVDKDGNLIEILSEVLPIDGTDDTYDSLIIIVFGIGATSLIALIAVFYRRR